MCLILLAWQAHPDYPLVVAANRDEFLNRPAAPLAPWAEHPEILAGRDLQGGGTWFGASRRGRFAALTNFRDPPSHRADAPSRGGLVSGALLSATATQATLQALAPQAPRYNGFNLLLWDGSSLGILESVSSRVSLLTPGIYGLSNEVLDSPWPKVEAGRQRLAQAVSNGAAEDALLALLRDDRPAADTALPATGVSLGWERLLSPAFIRAPGYGTRCSTLLKVRRDGVMLLTEWTWDSLGQPAGVVRQRIDPTTPD